MTVTWVNRDIHVALAAERLAAEAVVGGTGVPTGILRLQILETQQTVVGDQDDVITFTPRSEGPEEVVDVIVYEGTGITFGIARQNGEGPHVMVCCVRVHLYHGGADLVCRVISKNRGITKLSQNLKASQWIKYHLKRSITSNHCKVSKVVQILFSKPLGPFCLTFIEILKIRIIQTDTSLQFEYIIA